MLWAVSNALREEGVGANHELFRPCMSVLFKASQKLWLKKTGVTEQGGSTSDRMLLLAKQFTAYTIDQLNQDPTAEHMALAILNIIKMGEKLSKSEHTSVAPSLGRSNLEENVKESRKFFKNSPKGICKNSENACRNVEQVISKVELIAHNIKNTPAGSKQIPIEQTCEPNDSPNRLGKKPNVLLNSSNEITNSLTSQKHETASSEPLLSSPLTKSCRVSASRYCEIEQDSATKENSTRMPDHLKTDYVLNNRPSLVQECEKSVQRSGSKQVNPSSLSTTPHETTNNKCNKTSPDLSCRVTRRRSQELQELNTNLKDNETEFVDTAFDNVEKLQIISNVKHENVLNTRDADENNPQAKSVSPKSLKKTFSNKRRQSKEKRHCLFLSPTQGEANSMNCVESNSSLLLSGSQKTVVSLETKEHLISAAVVSSKVNVSGVSNSCTPHKNNTPLKSILCNPLVRTLRSNSKDSPNKTVTVNESENVYFVNTVNSDIDIENKTDRCKKTTLKRRTSLSSQASEVSEQESYSMSKTDDTVLHPTSVECADTEKSDDDFSWSQLLSMDLSNCSIIESGVNSENNKENVEDADVPDGSCRVAESQEDSKRFNPLQRLPVLTSCAVLSELVPGEAVDQTLRLFPLSTSGREVVDRAPPVLVPHWEHHPQEHVKTSSVESPPPLVPHWQSSDENTSLPESIMTHWQQQATSSASTSDKVMFDFEDTSYEIAFSSNKEDSTASSTCPPFEFPHLIDESKSSFSTLH